MLARRTGVLRFADLCFEFFGRHVENARKQPRNHLDVRDLGGIGEDGIHRQADGEFPALAVVDRAAHGADLKYALLLMLGFCEVFAIGEKLEVTQAGEHRRHPNHRQDPDDQPAETRVALLHGLRPTLSETCSCGDRVRFAGKGPPQRAANSCQFQLRLKSGPRMTAQPARLRHDGVARILDRSHLPGHRNRQAQLVPRNRIHAHRRAQCRHFQVQLLVQFRGLRALRFSCSTW